MTYEEVLRCARAQIGPYCKACPVCNGVACGSSIPGPGAKGTGAVAVRNYQAWQKLCVNLDTICENAPVVTQLELFGQSYRYPFFAGPVGAMRLHYGERYDDEAYNQILVAACAGGGISAFTGDGQAPGVFEATTVALASVHGRSIPTIKPWNQEEVFRRIDLAKSAGARILAMDIDAAGLPFLKGMQPPAGRKTVTELQEIVAYAGIPLVLKGIMTVSGAEKALEAGVAGIVVSNHGGRVLDQTPATAEVLPSIADAVGDRLTILVDGGIRSGIDVFKALALGAKAVLIGRPFVPMVYGGGAEGVRLYIEKLGAELRDTMELCGVQTLAQINRDCLFGLAES